MSAASTYYAGGRAVRYQQAAYDLRNGSYLEGNAITRLAGAPSVTFGVLLYLTSAPTGLHCFQHQQAGNTPDFALSMYFSAVVCELQTDQASAYLALAITPADYVGRYFMLWGVWQNQVLSVYRQFAGEPEVLLGSQPLAGVLPPPAASNYQLGSFIGRSTPGYLLQQQVWAKPLSAAERGRYGFGPVSSPRAKPELLSYLVAAPGQLMSQLYEASFYQQQVFPQGGPTLVLGKTPLKI